MMAKQLDGRWCDHKNINTFMDMFDKLEAYKNQHGDITLENNPLSEAEMEWLNEFLADFMIDVKVFMDAAAKIMTDAFIAMADAFRDIADSLARAQKDGRTRAFGAPAIAFQAPPVLGGVAADSLIPGAIPGSSRNGIYSAEEAARAGIPFAVPGVNVHNEGFSARINAQLDAMTDQARGEVVSRAIARRRRYES